MVLYPKTLAFNSVTIVLPVQDETYSLRQTVETVLRQSRSCLREFLIVVSHQTLPQSLAEAASLQYELGDLVVIHCQRLKGLGGALREAFDLARGSHVIMMASDLETDPTLVSILIEEARYSPNSVVTVNRWCRGGGFVGYNPIKLLMSAIFQRLFRLIYWTNLSDLTHGYRILPTKLVQSIKWTELGHPFLFETILKPLRLGVPVSEIPGRWQARSEGVTHNTFMRNFKYIGVGLRIRFMNPSYFLIRNASDKAPTPLSHGPVDSRASTQHPSQAR